MPSGIPIACVGVPRVSYGSLLGRLWDSHTHCRSSMTVQWNSHLGYGTPIGYLVELPWPICESPRYVVGVPRLMWAFHLTSMGLPWPMWKFHMSLVGVPLYCGSPTEHYMGFPLFMWEFHMTLVEVSLAQPRNVITSPP